MLSWQAQWWLIIWQLVCKFSLSFGLPRCLIMFWSQAYNNIKSTLLIKPSLSDVPSYISRLPLRTVPAPCRCWSMSRHRQVLNGAVAAIIAPRLNYICLYKPFQHGNQIGSAGLLSALWLVSRGSSRQRSCTKLKYPLYGEMTPMHTKWLIAENQPIR